jgi:Chromo (CHRromatin Organisation MOdifier) domain
LPTVEFAINSVTSRSTGQAPFEVVYGYLPRTFPPIVYDEDNPASMDFIENRMLVQRAAQDAIIAAKTEQSHYVNIHKKDDPEIKVGEPVVVSNESQISHLPKGRQKLAIKYVGPYTVTNTNPKKSTYTLDIPNSKRFNTFHIENIKKYVDPHLDLFPNRQRRQPRIVQAEQDLNLEIEKVIGHERRRNGDIRFLCKWEGFSDEDATYRAAEDFKSSPYGIRVVKDYVDSFGELPQELKEWARETDWIKDTSNEISRRSGASFGEGRV